MAYQITENARNLVAKKNLTPQFVVEIDGYGQLLTSAVITEVAKYGGPDLYYGKPGLVYGGSVEIEAQKDLISLDGTTSQITQQLMQTEGAASSTTQLTIALLNKDNIFADLIKPVGNNDIISKKATVYLGCAGMSFPEDYIRIFVGNVTDVGLKAGMINISISHPENEKRSEIFQKVQTELTADITDSEDEIPLATTQGMFLPGPLFETYVRIGDEIIQYTGIAGNTLTGCTRGEFDTIAEAHEEEDSLETFYVLGDNTPQSNALDLALKVLISGAGQWTGEVPAAYVDYNSFYFEGAKLVSKYNVQAGDFITTSGSAETANNLTDAEIISIVEDYDGTMIRVAQVTIPEVTTGAIATFKSKYDTLPDGLGLAPDQVDIEEFDRMASLYSSTFMNYKFYLKDTTNGKDLVNKEIFFPSALYSLPRKGRVSIGKTTPPIASTNAQTLNETTVLNPNDLTIVRSSLQNFYNAVNYQFEEDAVENRMLAGRVVLSATSNNRIKVKNRVYQIIAKGLRKSGDTETLIARNSQRILDRFQFGAESIRGIKVSFGIGWGIEVGDTVIVEGLQLIDSKTGERHLSPRVMEVTNRAFNFRQGIITLDVTDTAFSVRGRYGTLSPSSIIATGQTATEFIIKPSFGTPAGQKERIKWESYVGQKLLVHTEDWSQSGTATFLGFSPLNDDMMLFSPGLGFIPGPNDIVDVPYYPDASAYQKAVHCFQTPRVEVTANAPSQLQFQTSSPGVFFPGAIIMVHKPDFSTVSIETTVKEVVGNIVHLDSALGYQPSSGDEVDLIGFVSDEGLPYRLF